MSLTFGFYNSIDGDRKYNALQISSLFDGIIRDGIFMSIGDCFIVSEVSGMQVKVGTGRAWFNHTWTNNDSELIVDIPVSELILNRIDTVVLEINHSDNIRANSIKVIKGTPSSNPVKPELINDDYVHQYPLCDIYVEHEVTSIIQANITNRVGTSDCPFVTGILETVDIDDLLLQWNADFDDWFNQKIEDVDTLIVNLNNTFQSWFDGIKNTLDGDTAGNLLNLINENSDAIVDLNSEIETMNGRINDMESIILQLESQISSASSILTEAGEDLLTGNLVTIYQDKLYKLPSKLTLVINRDLGMQTASPTSMDSVPLDGNKVLVAYNEFSTGYPVVATFSVTDSNITADSNALVLSNYAINSIAIVKIAYNMFVILYSSTSSSYAQIITITNNTIVAGTAVTILSTNQRMLKAVLLEDNKIFVVGSSNNTNNSSYAQVLTISDSTITGGTIKSWSAGTNSAYGRDLIKLDNSRVLFGYEYGRSYVLPFSVSGTTITKGSPVQISPINNYISLYALDSNRVLACYKGTAYFELKILTVTDLTVDTSASSVITTNASNPFVGDLRFSDTEIIGVQSTVGLMKVTVSGTTITSITTLATGVFPYRTFFLTPFKIVTLTLSSSAQATCTINPHQMYDATGYVISDTGIYNNTKKAAYMTF